ncbi:LOW QUALITY PROTEIN: hypothetical protein SORBI_3006G062433 [Sorghum bicolor]|uniref:Uncharacterized protein n=1 Tax=Sorghum bicolor TaxID=4558 RepID=A0A1Z5RDK4_SORBI|nr:LOW QUALITY PROTEIN: hypothetical protein SORBI_3006G062433 [Sorghum bicolor]
MDGNVIAVITAYSLCPDLSVVLTYRLAQSYPITDTTAPCSHPLVVTASPQHHRSPLPSGPTSAPSSAPPHLLLLRRRPTSPPPMTPLLLHRRAFSSTRLEVEQPRSTGDRAVQRPPGCAPTRSCESSSRWFVGRKPIQPSMQWRICVSRPCLELCFPLFFNLFCWMILADWI